LPWGSRFCVLYASKQELLDMVVPYVKAGLDCNERCSVEVRDPLGGEEVAAALAVAIHDFAAKRASGQIEIAAAPDEIVAPEDAGHRAHDEGRLERRLDEAILRGYDGLRLVRCPLAGHYKQAASPAGSAFGQLSVLEAVLYPRSEVGAVDFMLLIQGYRFALVRNAANWEVIRGSEAQVAKDALVRSEEKLQALFENMSEGFAYHRIVLDAEGAPRDYVFLEVNEAFEKLTGLAAEEILGKRVTRVLPGIEKDPADWIGRYGRVALTGEPLRFESHAELLDRWYAVSAFSPCRGYFACTFADITERRRAQEALAASEARLKEADRHKDAFLAPLSHELRNPLAPIRNSLFVLERTEPGSDQAKNAQAIISRQVSHMTRLIDDLLDVTRVSRGKSQLQRTKLELGDAVRRTVEDHRQSFVTAGVQLDSKLSSEPMWLTADATRLVQVVGNLLGNAVKFTPRGGRVDIRLDRQGTLALLRVRDSGVGMTQAVLEHLFEPFMQAKETLHRSRGGLGLGLALVKGLVELHHGTVEARSAGPGQGSEFTITLPLEAPPQPEAGEQPHRSSFRRRVLIIEDKVDAADSLKTVLELCGHEVQAANDGRSGIALARTFRPEVVVCDIGLPGMDGYAVARTFRSDEDLAGVPLIALSGYAAPEDLQRGREAGFARHMAKPPDLDELQGLLEEVTRGVD